MNKFESKILKSPSNTNSRLKNFDWLTEQLEIIGSNWVEYLKQHLIITEKLFGEPEFPWDENERVIVSTLAASIMRSNANALIAEELPIDKKSALINGARCDLWAHIPCKNTEESFNFYMEAKRFRKHISSDKIQDALEGEHGIERMFLDNAKSRDGVINLKSPYSKARKHTHYIVGLIIIPMDGEIDANDISDIFNDIFCKSHKIQDTTRNMKNFPSAGIYLGKSDKNGSKSLMFASLSIIGRSDV